MSAPLVGASREGQRTASGDCPTRRAWNPHRSRSRGSGPAWCRWARMPTAAGRCSRRACRFPTARQWSTRASPGRRSIHRKTSSCPFPQRIPPRSENPTWSHLPAHRPGATRARIGKMPNHRWLPVASEVPTPPCCTPGRQKGNTPAPPDCTQPPARKRWRTPASRTYSSCVPQHRQ